MRIHTHAYMHVHMYTYMHTYTHVHTCKKKRDMNTEVGLTRKRKIGRKGEREDSNMREVSTIKIHYIHV